MKISTFEKIIVACLINGFLWVWCSYLLAFMDKISIAESLSEKAIVEIIGTILVYAIKRCVENLAKHNDWLDKSDTTSRSKNPHPDCD